MQKKKWLLVIIICIGLLLFIKLIESFVLEPIVKNKLKHDLGSIYDLYSIEANDVDISLITSTVHLLDVTLQADTNSQKKVKTLLSANISKISLSGVRFLKAWFWNTFDIDRIHFMGVRLVKRQVDNDKHLEDQLLLLLPFNIRVNTLTFSNTTVLFQNLETSRGFLTTEFTINKLSMQGWRVSKNDTITQESFKNIRYDITKVSSLTRDSLYQFHIYNLQGNEHAIRVDSILLQPQFLDYAFARRNSMEQDRIELKVQQVIVIDFDLNAFLEARDILAHQISLQTMTVDIFRDKRQPDNTTRKRMVQELLREYDGAIKVDLMKIVDGRIIYREHAEKAIQQGYISFMQLRGQLDHITNDSTQPPLRVKAGAVFMDKAPLNVDITFPINDLNNPFTVSGKLDAFNISDLNPMLETNAYMHTNGQLNYLAFTFDANQYKASGKLEMPYSHLELIAVSPNPDEKRSLKEVLISLIAGKVTYDDNPMEGKSVRHGVIDYERDPEKFFFNYSFRSILSGIKSVVSKKEVKRKKEKVRK